MGHVLDEAGSAFRQIETVRVNESLIRIHIVIVNISILVSVADFIVVYDAL